MTTKKNPLLVNLRRSHAPLAALVHIVVDYLLQRPVRELLNTAELTKAVVVGIRSIASEPANKQLLEQEIIQVIETLQSAEPQDSNLATNLPEATVEVIRSLAEQPFALNEDLMAELIDHNAARVLLREVIQLSLVRFSEQVAEVLPGGNIVTQFAATVRGFAALTVNRDGVTIEQLVNGSVEENLSPALRLTAGHLSDEHFAAELADWRGHVIDVLLGLPISDLLGELDQVDSEKLAGQIVAFLQSIAEWRKLDRLVAKSIEAALDRAGDESLLELLNGATAENEFREIVEKQLVRTFWPFVKSPEFEDWLNEFS